MKKNILSEKKLYIEGIYNYCDRWCEVCEYTSNCLLFTNESKMIAEEILSSNDMIEVEEEFEEDEDFIDEIEEEFFVDDDPEDDFKIDGKDNEPTQLENIAQNYFKTSIVFIKQVHEFFKVEDVSSVNKFKLENEIAYRDFEIFSRYCGLIGAKLSRATYGKKELQNNDYLDTEEFLRDDMNGSAKIAIIVIQSSIRSLNNLLSILPKFGNKIEELLVLLGRLLNDTEKEFPEYKNFKRPGFDD